MGGTGIGSRGRFGIKENAIETGLYGRTKDIELVVIFGGIELFVVTHAGRSKLEWRKGPKSSLLSFLRTRIGGGVVGGDDGR